MTTEIAVINRLGVALATDSAVTVSGMGDSPKVFDSGDKLFELSDRHSIGVMINGNMDILGVPWELLVRDFRDQSTPIDGASVRAWMQRFLDFAGNHRLMTDREEREFVLGLTADVVRRIKDGFQSRVLLMDRDRPPSLAELTDATIADLVAESVESNRAESLGDIVLDTLIREHGVAIDEALARGLPPMEPSERQLSEIRSLIFRRLLVDEQSEYTTGVIVAGYGADDMFPSLSVVEIEGRVCGRLKYTFKNNISIDRQSNRGGVISFAQTDVIDRILRGADGRFLKEGERWIRSAMDETKAAVVELFAKLGVPKVEAEVVFDDIKENIARGYRDEFSPQAKSDFQRAFDGIVALMPKRDLIEFAEALVSITVIERKASSEQATVGGAVDVAFITRHDGFVWIKRKHYFDKDLNPRYFWRKYGGAQLSEKPYGEGTPSGTSPEGSGEGDDKRSA